MQAFAANLHKIICRQMSPQIAFFGGINQIQEGFQIHRQGKPRHVIE